MLKKSSPLKHKECRHIFLTDEAHQKEHDSDVDVLEPKKEEPITSLYGEFEDFKPDISVVEKVEEAKKQDVQVAND